MSLLVLALSAFIVAALFAIGLAGSARFSSALGSLRAARVVVALLVALGWSAAAQFSWTP